ncbi:MAG: helix-turn-helix domain-containing protein [Syntrophomonadaceae bacterium]|nr:helix-turn-helix domain-containing protein [Syntrophomonadaceae bacterium]
MSNISKLPDNNLLSNMLNTIMQPETKSFEGIVETDTSINGLKINNHPGGKTAFLSSFDKNMSKSERRETVDSLLDKGHLQKDIAKMVGRSQATISRDKHKR